MLALPMDEGEIEGGGHDPNSQTAETPALADPGPADIVAPPLAPS